MQYTINNTSRNHYEVFDEHNRPAGQIRFNGWMPNKATITTADGTVYQVSGKGFWQIAKLIVKNGIEYGEVRPKFGVGFELSFEAGQHFILKRKKMFSLSTFVLSEGETNTEIASVQSHFSWSKFAYQYQVDVHAALYDTELNKLMPLLLVYLARLQRTQQAAAAS